MLAWLALWHADHNWPSLAAIFPPTTEAGHGVKALVPSVRTPAASLVPARRLTARLDTTNHRTASRTDSNRRCPGHSWWVGRWKKAWPIRCRRHRLRQEVLRLPRPIVNFGAHPSALPVRICVAVVTHMFRRPTSRHRWLSSRSMRQLTMSGQSLRVLKQVKLPRPCRIPSMPRTTWSYPRTRGVMRRRMGGDVVVRRSDH